jgi:RNA polymerase sigma factor (sigma-70 family)
MHDGLLRQFLRSLRRSADRDGRADLTDADLLRRFVREKDPAALEVIVYRHAALVLGVCRRILPRPADADDAFQATFLVFLQRAVTIREHATLASWLYRVAYRTALRAQRSAARRAVHERKVLTRAAAAWSPVGVANEVQPALDEELNRLPEKYRAPLVLHFLQGLSKEETARVLCCPVGTVSSRLHRGQEHLRRRLIRRGVTLTAVGLGVLLPREAVTALTVSDRIRSFLAVAAGGPSAGISPAVHALARSVARRMVLARFAGVAAILAVAGLVGGGAAAVARVTLPEDAPPGQAAVEESPADAIQARQGAEPFPNSPGYVWAVPPQGVGLRELSNHRDVTTAVETGNDGALLVTVTHPPRYSRAGRPYHRPVAFDADGKRYLFMMTAGSIGGQQAVNRYRLPPEVVAAERVRAVGVEELPPEGRKIAAEHAARLARARGLEPLPLPEPGQPYDFALTADDGRLVKSGDFRGQVVVLHCWAYWHPSSLEQREQLAELLGSRPDDGPRVVGIDLNNAGDTARGARYWLSSPGKSWHVVDEKESQQKAADGRRAPWPNVRVPRDLADRELWEQACEIFALPRVLLLDRRGVLRHDTPSDLPAAITGLLREP